jgi:hypothetical protein
LELTEARVAGGVLQSVEAIGPEAVAGMIEFLPEEALTLADTER